MEDRLILNRKKEWRKKKRKKKKEYESSKFYSTYLGTTKEGWKFPKPQVSLEASQSERDDVSPKRKERKRKEKKKDKRNKKSIFQGVRRIEIQGSWRRLELPVWPDSCSVANL